MDTGCVRNNKLSCIELPTLQVYQVAKQHEAFKVQLREKGSNRVAVRFVGTVPVYVKRGEQLLQFETRNYSETGMLMREIVSPHLSVFNDGDVIEGEIGSQRHNVVPFGGKVVRRFEGRRRHLVRCSVARDRVRDGRRVRVQREQPRHRERE